MVAKTTLQRYRGDKLLQKTHPKDLITKKPDPRVEFESNYLSGDHEAIVSKVVWDAVQAKLKKNAFSASHRSDLRSKSSAMRSERPLL